jgi:iron complex transport system permease protein
MIQDRPFSIARTLAVSLGMLIVLLAAMVVGLGLGSSGSAFKALLDLGLGSSGQMPVAQAIVWRLRFPRVLLAAQAGAALSLGGLVFQALLRNPLSEPYILGVSGGAAVGAIIGILMGLPHFPGVSMTAFAGSMATLVLVMIIVSGQTTARNDTLLLAGVMVNAFCSAIILFLISMTQDVRIHNILFWLMGDLSSADLHQAGLLGMVLLPCAVVAFWLSHPMNLLLTGSEMAQSLGVNVRAVFLTLLIITSLMVSATVCYCGLLGFVGLVIPHLLRQLFGPDHRLLVPASLLGGAAYMVICDVLSRILSQHGEIPVGVITAMIGAPVFIFLLKRSVRS